MTAPAFAPHALALALSIALAACSSSTAEFDQPDIADTSPPLLLEGTSYEAAAKVQLPPVQPAEEAGLHHVFKLSDGIISGAEPADPEALERLANWGVKTILSVDGKVPDAATAEALGMRYVHVPSQYSGIDREELLEISKTFRELEGPFYVHCFHGKHRGPAAAAIGRVVLDGVPRDQAIAEMRQWCATSSKYEGLYSTVATAHIPTPEESRANDFDFSPAHSFEGMRAGMIEMTRKWDLVKASKARGWAVDPEHPDVDPLQEATQLHQVFTACEDLKSTEAWADDFRVWLRDGVEGSETLVRALSLCSQEGENETTWRAMAGQAYDQVAKSCADCHAAYRD